MSPRLGGAVAATPGVGAWALVGSTAPRLWPLAALGAAVLIGACVEQRLRWALLPSLGTAVVAVLPVAAAGSLPLGWAAVLGMLLLGATLAVDLVESVEDAAAPVRPYAESWAVAVAPLAACGALAAAAAVIAAAAPLPASFLLALLGPAAAVAVAALVIRRASTAK